MARAQKFFKDRKTYEKWRGESVEVCAEDVSFAIDKIEWLASQGDEFWKHVDTKHIGAIGQSFGGAVALRATRKDKRIKCGVNMDERLDPEDVDKPFTTPFLFLMGEKSHQWFKKEKLDEVMRLTKTKRTNMYTVMFKDVAHGLFCDIPRYSRITLFTKFMIGQDNLKQGIPIGKVIDLFENKVIPYTVEFLEKYLKNKPSKIFPNERGEIVVS
jgi:dienelactone hydrolase